MWQMNEAFMAAKDAAANVPGNGEAGSYTAAIFQEEFSAVSGCRKEQPGAGENPGPVYFPGK